ncbi:hypothetical protein ANCCEY_15480, partial [Ancylostoma ceylanicum]
LYSSRVIELLEELRRLHSDCLETDRPPSTVPSSVVVIGSEDEEKAATNRAIEELHGKQLSLERDCDDEEEAQFLLGNNTDRDEECADDGVAMTVDSATLAAPTDAHTIIIASKVDRHWRQRPQNMLFVPQKSYFPSGGVTLRQQLVYPLKALPVEKGIYSLTFLVELQLQ